MYQDTQRFYCFGCGARGDVLDFLRLREGLALAEAIQRLAGSPLDTRAPLIRGAPSIPKASTERDPALLGAAARFYATLLGRRPEAQAYLRQRGITADTAARLGLGYATGRHLWEHLKGFGFSEGSIAASGLFLGRRERFAGRVVVPEVQQGQVTWLTGRTIGSGEPRFQALPGHKPLLGLGGLGHPGVVVLTEGVFDWLTLVQWGLPACATLGSHGLERLAAALVGCRRVYLALDADRAGREATEGLLTLLGPRAVPVPLPNGAKDVAELAPHPEGRSSFLRLLAQARRGSGPARPVNTPGPRGSAEGCWPRQ